MNLLQVSSGAGPEEVRYFVAHLASTLEKLCLERGVTVSSVVLHGDERAPRSAELALEGLPMFALEDLLGTHVLVAKSAHRGRKARKRWFVGVSLHAVAREQHAAPDIAPGEVEFSIARAGGPGGQHVNTTDSAVRIRHIPTGICIRVASERSQHQNKSAAMSRLSSVLASRAQEEQRRSERSLRGAHYHFERGSAVRVWRFDTRSGALVPH